MAGFRQQLRIYGAYYRWLQQTLPRAFTLDGCQKQVKERMAQRQPSFVQLVRDCIFGNPRSPYLPLLHQAGFGLRDIERLVANEGVEATLERLRDGGVYFTLDEFKGDQDVVRDGVRFRCLESDFDNPKPEPGVRVQSGGSRSEGTTTFLQFAYASETVPYFGFMLAEHGCLDLPTGLWYPTLPAVSGFFKLMRLTFIGNPPKRWFTQVENRISDRIRSRAALGAAMFVGRSRDLRLPTPELVPVSNAGVIARWMAESRDREKGCSLFTYPSSAVRVARAAVEEGLSLEATVFLVVGEPLTVAKRKAIELSGARVVNFYGFTELGIVGSACKHAASKWTHDDIHIFTDALAVVQLPRQIGAGGSTVDSLLFTSLLPHVAPKILLNVESGDDGLIETRECDCRFDDLGWTDHAYRLQSFSKLTGEGVTFVGTDLVRVIEEVLPARFGGTPADYQFLEEEDADGFTRLYLLVSPTLGQLDEDAIRATLLEALQQEGARGLVSATVWDETGTVRIRREYPEVTPVGKILTFHVQH
jgi:hypothetical protein